MSNVEYAEARRTARPKMTERDQNQYTGIARHPLGRAWLYRRYIEAAESGKSEQAERVRLEARDLGVTI